MSSGSGEAATGERPRLTRVYETVLYASDLAATADFYRSVLGLKPTSTPDDKLFATFLLPDGSALLVFDPAESSVPGRDFPSHGAHGEGHVAFSVAAGALDDWRRVLADANVEVEREASGGRGAVSVYFRDPAGNSVELVEGQIWE